MCIEEQHVTERLNDTRNGRGRVAPITFPKRIQGAGGRDTPEVGRVLLINFPFLGGVEEG
jgi:hypothetical protein